VSLNKREWSGHPYKTLFKDRFMRDQMRYYEVYARRIFKWTLARKSERWTKFICLSAEYN